MQLDEEVHSGIYTVSSYGDGQFTVLGTKHASALIISRDYMQPVSTDVVTDVEALQAALAPADHASDGTVLIFGTGSKQVFPDNATLKTLMRSQAGHKRVVEVMDSGAACRTYNLLVGDGRRVIAVLMPTS